MIVNDGQIQLVMLCNAFPVFNTGAAQRIHTQLQAGFLNRRHIDDIRQPFHKRLNQILLFHVAGGHRLIKRNTFNAFQTVGQQRVCTIFHHFGDVSVSRAAVRRVVFDTTVFRRVVGWRNDDTVSLRATFFVVHKDRV